MHGMRWVPPGLASQRIGSIGKVCHLKRYLLGRIFRAQTSLQSWSPWVRSVKQMRSCCTCTHLPIEPVAASTRFALGELCQQLHLVTTEPREHLQSALTSSCGRSLVDPRFRMSLPKSTPDSRRASGIQVPARPPLRSTLASTARHSTSGCGTTILRRDLARVMPV